MLTAVRHRVAAEEPQAKGAKDIYSEFTGRGNTNRSLKEMLNPTKYVKKYKFKRDVKLIKEGLYPPELDIKLWREEHVV